jgi:hypothetical protein
LTKGVVLRVTLLLAAVVLGGGAAWLIVTSSTQRGLELGVLAGLWSALMAAFAMFGSRRLVHPVEAAYNVQARASAELERVQPTEIQAAITREVGALRAEIAELRTELLEKVGGELRVERIETTRVLGSDIEALQHEVRQIVEPARVLPPPVLPEPVAALQMSTLPATATLPQPPVDAFADLPRIRPFTEFELDSIEDEPAYAGRRRRAEDGEQRNLLARIFEREGVTS